MSDNDADKLKDARAEIGRIKSLAAQELEEEGVIQGKLRSEIATLKAELGAARSQILNLQTIGLAAEQTIQRQAAEWQAECIDKAKILAELEAALSKFIATEMDLGFCKAELEQARKQLWQAQVTIKRLER